MNIYIIKFSIVYGIKINKRLKKITLLMSLII